MKPSRKYAHISPIEQYTLVAMRGKNSIPFAAPESAELRAAAPESDGDTEADATEVEEEIR